MTPRPDPSSTVRLERLLPAAPDQVYRAWLDPDILLRWFAPEGFSPAGVEVDERVGGRLAVWHAGADGEDLGGAECEIVDLVPAERIVLRWTFVGRDRVVEPDHASLLTVTLRPAGAGTLLTLVHDRLDGLGAAMPDVAGQVENGWSGTLDRLDAALVPG